MVTEAHCVRSACRVLDVSESTFFADRGRVASKRSIRHAWLTDLITQAHGASRGTYGARRVHADLTIGMGVSVGHNAVEMLMRRAGLKGLPGNRRRRPTHQPPTATDLVDRQFSRDGPNELWVTDITEHRRVKWIALGLMEVPACSGFPAARVLTMVSCVGVAWS